MIPLVVKSHWKLAFKSVVKAVKVTVNTLLNSLKLSVKRAKKYDDIVIKKRETEIVSKYFSYFNGVDDELVRDSREV